MAVLGIFGKKKKYRGKNKDPQEKLKKQLAKIQLKAIDYQMKNNPDALLKRALKGTLFDHDEEEPITLDMLAKISTLIKPLGLKIAPAHGGDSDGDGSLVSVLGRFFDSAMGEEVGKTIGAIMSGQMQPSPGQVDQVRSTITTVEQHRPQIEEPKTQEEEEQATMIYTFVKLSIQNKTPEEAARWLLSQVRQHPEAAPFVSQFLNVPEDQIPTMLDGWVQKQPGSRDFVNWLKSRYPWFLEIVREVRKQSTPTQQPNNVVMGL